MERMELYVNDFEKLAHVIQQAWSTQSRGDNRQIQGKMARAWRKKYEIYIFLRFREKKPHS